MRKLHGVITAMTTPFGPDGELDAAGVAAQTEFLIGKGVDCLYPTGTTGEMYLMSADEREKVAETIVETAAGRATVYIHTGAMRQDDTIRLARHAATIGADGIGVVTPSYFTVDRRAMAEYYRAVCAAVPEDFPVYVYVIPQLAHNDIAPDVMEEIAAANPNVVGVKYSYPDMSRLIEYTQVRGGDFSVVFGADHMFLPALVAGADGTVSGCSGPLPEPFVDVYRQFLAGDVAGAQKAQRTATEWCALTRYGADMSIFKTILADRGVPAGHMRRPLLDLTADQVTALLDRARPFYS